MSSTRSPDQLRRDALQIWHAGLDAVRSDRLVKNTVSVSGNTLSIGDAEIDLRSVRNIVVVGAGKAGAGMAAGLEAALGPRVLVEKQVRGWINVPEDCAQPAGQIHLHPSRPAGVNEPTEAGVAGAAEIRRLVESAAADDLCIALISGGASALLPDPPPGVPLAEKLAVTRFLSGAGANIEEINTVRKQISQIKGGGLIRACRASRLFALIISDVLGDPLDVIASGPTVLDRSTPRDALAVLDRFNVREAGLAPRTIEYLESVRNPRSAPSCEVHNLVIGNNSTAVSAAAAEATRLGYAIAANSAARSEGYAEDVGRELASQAVEVQKHQGPSCLISGGEPVVKLIAADKRGRGGRNQQLVLAAMEQWLTTNAEGMALLSAGTDGEDGPTDAAGAFCDDLILAECRRRSLDPAEYLARNDAYSLFEQLGGLVKTGPTHTNVCDLRVVLVDRTE
jgi:glycerate 2-kinase